MSSAAGRASPRLNAAIVGAAITPVGVWPEEDSFTLAASALSAALADAGLARSDLDGFVWNLGRPSGQDYDVLVDALGLNVRFTTQFWTHGRFTGSSLIVAALAVSAGLADHVVCLGGTKRRPGGGPRAAAFGDSVNGDLGPYGQTTFVHDAALSFQRYLALHGAKCERLADVVVAAREYAVENETAYRREPLTREDYLAAPMVVEPLRWLDCFPFGSVGSPMNDYGACVIISRADLAESLGPQPAYFLAGRGIQASREEAYFGRPGLGLFRQSADTFDPSDWDLGSYRDAGIAPTDVDAFYTYDAFSSCVWMALERFGHCAPGEAGEWATKERIGPGGSFPVNTNGGMLAQGHTAGWGHIVELSQQLRGRVGARQIEGIEIAQWATVFGDSVLLTNDPERLSQ